MDIKQKNNSMKNILINQIIKNKPKQIQKQKTKINPETSKKQYIFEESINIINEEKPKTSISPYIKHTYYKRKNISYKKSPLSFYQKAHFSRENSNELFNSIRKPYNHSKFYEILSLFRERSLSESKSYSNMSSFCCGNNKANFNFVNKSESSGSLNIKNNKKNMMKIDNNIGVIKNKNINENKNNAILRHIENNNNNKKEIIITNNNIKKLKKNLSNYMPDKNKKIKQRNKNNILSNKKGESNNNSTKKKLHKVQTNVNYKKQDKKTIFCNSQKINNKILSKIHPKKAITDIFIHYSRNNFPNDNNINITNHIKGSGKSFKLNNYIPYLNPSENSRNKKISYLRQKKSSSLKNEFNNLAKYKENNINKLNNEHIRTYELLSIKIRDFSENELYKNSAILIQSIFRGYITRKKFYYLFLFFLRLSKASEIIENVIINNTYNKIILFLKKTKNNFNNVFCKNIDFFSAKITESNYEIEEGFKINNNKKLQNSTTQTVEDGIDKEYQKKFNENLRVLNMVMIENCNLKDVCNKNKENEIEIKKLLNEIKKKQSIIDIVTNDNQNLAKKLKNMQKNKNSSLTYEKVNNFKIGKINNILNVKNKNINKLLIFTISNHIKKKLKIYLNEMKNGILFQNMLKMYKREIQTNKLTKIILKNSNKEQKLLSHYFSKFYYNGIIVDKIKIENSANIKCMKINCINLFNILSNKYKNIQKKYFNKLYKAKTDNKIKNINEQKNCEIHKLKKLINLIENRVKKYNEIKCKNLLIKWKLTNKIFSIKSQIDEKKRRKRQKQRQKKKNENKLLNNIKSISLNKEKIKDKDTFNFGEHSITTDLSNEMNYDNYKNNIIKGTEKLYELLIKAAINYKLISQNKKINISIMRKSKSDNNINDDNYDKDSGDSFGI